MVLDVLGVFQCPAQVAFLQVTLEHIAPANHTGKGKGPNREGHKQAFAHAGEHSVYADMSKNLMVDRSEERRVGKECRAGWAPNHEKKKRDKIERAQV